MHRISRMSKNLSELAAVHFYSSLSFKRSLSRKKSLWFGMSPGVFSYFNATDCEFTTALQHRDLVAFWHKKHSMRATSLANSLSGPVVP